MSVRTADFLVVGGGVIGLTLAIEIRRQNPESSVLLLEKETDIACHASGRNSGVLHAGFYYQGDSLKAKFCKQGNALLREYCEEKKLAINHCGKLVVCQGEEDLTTLDTLFRRARSNGIDVKKITEYEAAQIDSNVLTFESALWSPTTCTVNPVEVMQALYRDACDAGVEFAFETEYLYRKNKKGLIKTTKEDIFAGYLVNAAGLYADKIASQWGFSENYRILPFKGLYLYSSVSSANPNLPKVHVYPVPDLNFPFLGVHFTLTVDGLAKLGPTAIPVLWREHYHGLQGMNLGEMGEILFREIQLFASNKFNFRKLAFSEIHKYNKQNIIKEASRLYRQTKSLDFNKWGKPGIRAQLVNTKSKALEMDFIFEGDEKSFHVLNAVSPAFTCSMPFSSYLYQQIDSFINT